MPRGAVKEKPQTNILEKRVDDTDLLAQLEIFAETAQAHRDHMKAKKAIDIRVEQMDGLEEGDVLRVGAFTIPIVTRSGGGFEVPSWTKHLPGKIVDTTAPNAGDDAGDED